MEKWEEKYEYIKRIPQEPTLEDWNKQNAEYSRRLAKIVDTNSKEYKDIVAERKNAKKIYQDLSRNKEGTNISNYAQIKKNIPLIEKQKENRDIYQQLLDELLALQKENDVKVAKRVELQKEAERLDTELKELKETEKHCLIAINANNATPEQKEHATRVLSETRSKIKQNDTDFSNNRLALQEEEKKPIKEVPKENIEEARADVARCNRICELLVEGKTMQEVIAEVGTKKEKQTSTRTNGKTPETKEQRSVPTGVETVSEAEETEQEEIGPEEIEQEEIEPEGTRPEGKIILEISKDGTRTLLNDKEITTLQKDGLPQKNGELPTEGYVTNELNRQENRHMLGEKEVEELQRMYKDALNEKDEQKRAELVDKMKSKLEIKYDLHGLRNVKLKREARRALIADVKREKDLGVASVKAPWYIKAQWGIKDLLTKGMNSAKNLLNKGMNSAKNLLNRGKNTEALTEKSTEQQGESTEQQAEVEGAEVEGESKVKFDRLGNRTVKTPEEAQAEARSASVQGAPVQETPVKEEER